MAKKRCPTCGSTKYHTVPGGLRACEEGHVDASYRRETVDLGGEPSQSTQRIRRHKGDKKKKVWKSKGNPEIYHGHEKEFLYYECIHLLVRHQVKALRTVWGLPVELEIITRDLLSLALLLHPLPPPPEQDQPPTAPSSPRPKPSSSLPAEPDPTSNTPPGLSTRLLQGGMEEEDIEGGKGDEDDPDQPIRDLEKAHEADEEEEEEEEQEEEEIPERPDAGENPDAEDRPRRRKKNRPDNELYEVMKPADCLSIIIVACWALRVPVMFKEFISLINSHQLPYLEFAHSTLIPPEMRKHFAQEFYLTLSPAWAPSTMALYRRTSNFALQLQERFAIKIPELNAPPVIWKCIRSLGGSPAIYPAVISLSRSIQLHLSLHQGLAPNPVHNPRSEAQTPEDRILRPGEGWEGDRVPPELGIMAVVVIVLKMVYGLDGRDRLPVNDEDAATVLMGKMDWLKAIRSMQSLEKGEFSDERLADGDFDIIALEGQDIDQYLDLCETMLASGVSKPKALDLLASRFPPPPPSSPPNPLDDNTPPSTLTFPHRSSKLPTPLDVLPPGPIHPPLPEYFDDQHRFPTFLLPGEAHHRFSRLDVMGEMPREMELVMLEAARVVGVKKQELVVVLEELEARLTRKGGLGVGSGGGKMAENEDGDEEEDDDE